MTGIDCATMCSLINNQQKQFIQEYSELYLKNKLFDCILYSEDGAEFKTHKELFGQTKFMRELLKSTNCCNTIEIICPCSKEDLSQIIDFVNKGKILCDNETEFAKILENLGKIFGYPTEFSSADKFSFEN